MKLTRLIHVGAREIGLDEDGRRDFYQRVTGKSHQNQMSEADKQKVLDALKASGFKVKGRPSSNKAYVRLIYALWRSIGEAGGLSDPSIHALRSFVKRETGVGDPEWLTYQQANPVIEALKAMEKRAKAGKEDA